MRGARAFTMGMEQAEGESTAVGRTNKDYVQARRGAAGAGKGKDSLEAVQG